MNDLNEPHLSSPNPISKIEHRKRHRRRMINKSVWRGELIGRRKKVLSRKGINNISLQNCKKIKNKVNVKIFPLTTSILVLVLIIFFAQFVIGITAINSNSNTANNPNILMENYPSIQKENVSAEQFTENIWKIELTNEIGPLKEWQAFLKKSKQNQPMCHIWNAGSPSDLCARNHWHRIRRMRELSIFARCPEGYANLQLIDIFQLDWREIRTEEDLLSHSEHLRHGPEGQSCLLGAAESKDCLNCFNKLNFAFERLEKAFWSFSNILQRFDCRLVVIKQQPKVELSATRPFSPNTTCHNCAEWYRKWLLINLVGIWKKRPCINWCYYTQLACPHLATNKVVEFAGHPVFLCRDQRLMVDHKENLMLMDCSCFHPCDLIQNRIAQFDSNKTKAMLEGDRNQSFDFFHVLSYCQNRENICTK